MPNHRAQYPDQFIQDNQRRQANASPDESDRLVAKIVNFVRRANITVSPPAHIKPTVWSNPVDQSAQAVVPLAVGTYQTVVRYQAPAGRWARISSYGVNVLDAAYTYNGSILWRLVINGQPMGDGMSNWGIQRGSIIQPRETFIVLREDDVLEFQVRRAVAAAADQTVEMAFSGWTWRLRNNYEGTAGSVTAF